MLGTKLIRFFFHSTHTSPTGADMVAQAFVQAIATAMNGTTSLTDYMITDYATVY